MKTVYFLAAALCGAPLLSAQAATPQYSRDIRPLLSENCFACHGPDQANRAAGLRLDVRRAATAELPGGGRAIAPKDAAASELLKRVTSHDEALRMPPADSGKQLTPAQIAMLREWIEQGAPYQEHWAFVAPTRPPTPTPDGGAIVRTPVDAFVVEGLGEVGCGQAPEADRRTLLRRLSLDLTGLPPTPAEVEAFVADDRPDAYEQAVERLLESPRHGEHMARYWLDAARYGDTHGLHLDNYREMWPYRDWIIDAFNANMPWDQFVVKQLAGDLLPNPSLADHIATGFNRCHVSTSEGGSIDKEVEVRNVVDRVSTTGSVFMGLTMGCAVCHDHKYDPITQKDFYASYAFFNSIDGPAMDQNTRDTAPSLFAPTAEQAEQIAGLEQEIARRRAELLREDDVFEQEQRDWAEAMAREMKEPATVTCSQWSLVGPFFNPLRYLTSHRFGPEGNTVDLNADYDAGRPERLTWRPRPDWVDGQSHADISGFVAANYVFRTLRADKPTEIVAKVRVRGGWAAFLNNESIHNQLGEQLSLDGPPVELRLKLKEGENQLLLKLINPPHDGGTDVTSAFSFEWPDDAPVSRLPTGVAAALAVDEDQRTAEQQSAVRLHYRLTVSQDPGVRRAAEAVNEAMRRLAVAQSAVATTLVMREKPEAEPAYLLLRGQYDAPDEQRGPLAREAPEFLPPLPDGAPRNRLGYAQWLIAPEHPLHARVTVNRLWQQFFGVGIVETADDFGMQGAWPSHPELLDWLAVEFRESGWDMRRIIRLITHSHTYRQSSRARPETADADPRNRLLARGPRHRLDAEVIRDQALAISGQLVQKLGGPSVKPPQPAGLWKAVAYSGSNTNLFKADSTREAVHRRSVYTFWKRTSPPPQMAILDAPSRESCVVRRERTNTPLQALLLMNEEQFVAAGRSLAERCLRAAPDASPDEIAARMFSLALLREPEAAERDALCRLFHQSRARYADDPAAAQALLSIGVPPCDPDLNSVEVAAWTLAANAVLNLDELIVKE